MRRAKTVNLKLAVSLLFLLACSVRSAEAATCTVTATSVSFGNFSGTLINITGTLKVKCPNGAAYQVSLSPGAGIGATITNRRMTGLLLAQLGYALYSDAGHTVNWGNSVGTGWVTGTGTGTRKTLNVYAQLPGNQYAPTGSYTDATVIVSVTGSGLTTVTSTFSVKATVQAACTLSASTLAFGVYSGSLINSTSSISVTCTNTTTYNVGLSAGNASGATVTNRSMTGPGSALLGYKLFSNSGHTINWGNTVGTDTVAATGTGIVQSLTVYGQIPAAQTSAPVGSYADIIVATITY
ncbi:MAG: spore coat U domain-containing protein [Edaphobacter sp.]